jgi:hypothetical protein
MAENFVDVSELERERRKKFADHRAPPWQPGQSGNPKGRQRGSRSKFSETFREDFHTTWEKYGISALELCATEDPTGFIRIAASLMPRHIALNVGLDATQFVATFRQAVELLGNEPPARLSRRRPKVIEAEVIDADPD